MTEPSHDALKRSTQAETAPPPPPRWWRWVGLQRRPGRYLNVRPSRRAVIIVSAVFLVGMVAMAEYSSHPSFCRNCHIMEPYYHNWLESSHRDVTCIKCHFEPGFKGMIKGKFKATSKPVKFITGTFGSRPRPQVSDASCLQSGCHDTRLLEGRIVWAVESSRGDTIDINFDHTPHLTEVRRSKQLRCVSCHSQIAMGEHMTVTVDACHLCHFKDVQHGRDDETIGGCRSCHDAPRHELRLTTGYFNHSEYVDRVSCENCHANTIAGDGHVPRQVCWTCHNQPQYVAKADDTELMHRMHVSENKVDCGSCHTPITHRIDARPISALHEGLAQANTCGQCHDSSHSAPMDLYQGTGGRGVIDMPSAMHRSHVECIACHSGPKREAPVAAIAGQTYLATQEACDSCHGTRYADTVALWQQTLAEQLERAEILLAQARRMTSGQSQYRQLIEDAEHNIRFVRHGGGVHNMPYATALLNASIEWCEQVMWQARGGDGP